MVLTYDVWERFNELNMTAHSFTLMGEPKVETYFSNYMKYSEVDLFQPVDLFDSIGKVWLIVKQDEDIPHFVFPVEVNFLRDYPEIDYRPHIAYTHTELFKRSFNRIEELIRGMGFQKVNLVFFLPIGLVNKDPIIIDLSKKGSLTKEVYAHTQVLLEGIKRPANKRFFDFLKTVALDRVVGVRKAGDQNFSFYCTTSFKKVLDEMYEWFDYQFVSNNPVITQSEPHDDWVVWYHKDFQKEVVYLVEKYRNLLMEEWFVKQFVITFGSTYIPMRSDNKIVYRDISEFREIVLKPKEFVHLEKNKVNKRKKVENGKR
ncbi:MAG: hypothetical protein N3A54_01300 [Patescibacteria group bacterium]|nr:hypothetical protein [Patescibacteria group bacterium]